MLCILRNSDDPPDLRLRSFRRKALIVIGFEMLVLMMLIVVYCAMLPERGHHFVYPIVAAAICAWLGIVLYLALRCPARFWPVALIATTAILIDVAIGIFCFDSRPIQFLFVVAAGVVAISCVMEVVKNDFPSAR